MTSAYATARAVKPHVRRLGGLFMKSGLAHERAKTMELKGFPYYFGGRGSVLGTVDAGVVASIFGFFPPEFVARHWAAARAAAAPEEFLAHYMDTCHRWGRERLAGLDRPERLAELMEKIVAAADAPLIPLFAGWRAVPLPDEPLARVAQLSHVLREHRGGLHLCAVRAGQMTPLDAIRTREDGDRRARFLGWEDMADEVTEVQRKQRIDVEELTDDLAAPAYAALDREELEELTDLLGRAYRYATAT